MSQTGVAYSAMKNILGNSDIFPTLPGLASSYKFGELEEKIQLFYSKR